METKSNKGRLILRVKEDERIHIEDVVVSVRYKNGRIEVLIEADRAKAIWREVAFCDEHEHQGL